MKKITLTVVFSLCGFLPLTANAQWAVTDPGATAQLVVLTNTALSQVTTLSSLLNIAEKTSKARSAVSTVIKTVSDINKLIMLGKAATSDTHYLLTFISRGPKVVSPKIALRYSGLCISTTENMIRYIERATSLISSGLFDASDAERLGMIDDLEQKMELDMMKLSTERARIEREERMRKLSTFVLSTQYGK